MSKTQSKSSKKWLAKVTQRSNALDLERDVFKQNWRRGNPEFQEPKLSRNLALVERFRVTGARRGKSSGEVAIAWALRNPAVKGATVGARNAKQFDGIIGGATFRLTPKELPRSKRLVDRRSVTVACV